MTRLGSKKRPAVIRVPTQERAQEFIDACAQHDWELIVGIEPEQPEDVTDVLKLLHPERFTVRVDSSVSRNDLCPCGSGAKYKKCCLRANRTAAT
jgi:SWIM/SEC-C metal-binding protein